MKNYFSEKQVLKRNYEDILELPHPVSKVHPPMDRKDRAAQFSPFAALTGYEDAVKEAARLTEEKPEAGEDELQRLDEVFCFLEACEEELPEVSLVYFRPDGRKEGGAWLRTKGRVKKIDRCERMLVLDHGQKIPFEDICSAEIENRGYSDKT